MFSHKELTKEMPKLKKFACKLCKTEDEANDLTQAALLRALEKKGMFEENTNLYGWVSKIMYNMFVNDYRRKVKFETQYDPEDYIASRKTVARQEQKLELSKVKEAVSELSDEHRSVLVMVCVKGMKYKQVASILDIPVGTVRSRLSRAREQLEDMLGEDEILMNLQAHETRAMPFKAAR
jgi:RNA polymerase sigma-70 factor (ECF subfamily)